MLLRRVPLRCKSLATLSKLQYPTRSVPVFTRLAYLPDFYSTKAFRQLPTYKLCRKRTLPTQTAYNPRNFSSSIPTAGKMASGDAYMDFLNTANQDPSAGRPQERQPKATNAAEFRATETGVETPAVLIKAVKDAYYTSESDEPFVPVALAWKKGLPNEEEFAGLIGHWDPGSAEVDITDPAEWDTQGQYSDLVQAVRDAGKGNDVRVYRIVGNGSSRVEYWLVTATGRELVGVKALAIES